ncbi:MAG: hypothetical protein JWL70_1502 [Acidimicrobiia bacterium]|nr:hypothetical protein [Acidimicrobiia bacterium]
MQRGRLNIVQNLRLESVHQHDCVVRAQLTDADGIARSATLCFDDIWSAFANRAELDLWQAEGTVLTHVWGWGEGVLIDEERLLRRAAEDEPCR